jgi:hypothetical protein
MSNVVDESLIRAVTILLIIFGIMTWVPDSLSCFPWHQMTSTEGIDAKALPAGPLPSVCNFMTW